MTAPTDWTRWRKCQVCGADIGEACADFTGAFVLDGRTGVPVRHEIPLPHGSRKPRTGGPP